MDNNTPNPDVVSETVMNENDVKEVDEVNEVNEEAAEENAGKKEKHKLSFYFTGSIIMSWLAILTESIYSALVGGLFGKIFTAYSSIEAAFKRGFLNSKIWGNRKVGGWMRQTRKFFAEGFENSFLQSIAQSRIT